jgi:hypothetical protein
LTKSAPPDGDFVKEYLGAESYGFLLELEKFLNDHYDLKKELKFPFGSSYGWGYKYSHLCYTFFEAGAFTVTQQARRLLCSRRPEIAAGPVGKGKPALAGSLSLRRTRRLDSLQGN